MAGMMTVFRKELSDHLGSKRFLILFAIIILLSTLSAYQGADYIKNNPDAGFLAIFSGGRLAFSFISLMVYFGPLVGLALGFDSINKERTSGSLSVLLTYPIFRDSVFNGKFLAGVAAIASLVGGTIVIMCGVATPLLGFGPTLEQMVSIVALTLLTILYLAFWLSLGLLFSVLAKKTSTSMLASIATWLFSVMIVSVIAALVASLMVPLPFQPLGAPENFRGFGQATQTEEYRSLMQARSEIQTNIGRISPSNLYNEAASSILGLRASAFFVVGGMQQQIRPSLAQGIAASWPQVLAIFVGMLACFVISYLRFLRLEIRPGG
ncbi:MAG: hypothetical protein APZ16_06770 [Candidatus Hadarchaeum yellowstonense]|uniref:ABC transporter permease n=1 Tax=Hadarchaeum yellowstonense TaxID=1776334 RepID=A0A147JU01_HADYE|nr:MAG: hypothetical protein APZ16_06770 [Candidatus Hadarchaeum yellowstonense]